MKERKNTKPATKRLHNRDINKLRAELLSRVHTAVGIFLIVIIAYLLLVLLGYQPQDPSWANNIPVEQTRNPGGIVGAWTSYTLYFLFGAPILLFFPLAIGITAWHYLRHRADKSSMLNEHLVTWVAFVLTIVASCGLASLHFSAGELPFTAGGRVGEVVSRNFLSKAGMVGSTLLLSGLALVGITFMTGLSWLKLMDRIGLFVFQTIEKTQALIFWIAERYKTHIAAEERNKIVVKRKEKLLRTAQPRIEPQIESVKPSTRKLREKQIKLPTIDSSTELPPLSLLDGVAEKTEAYSEKEIEQMAKQLEIKLQDFGIEAQTTAAQSGPVVTRFELSPAPGTKASSISNIEKDLARSMSVPSLRVVEVIPGKSVIGIEVPNNEASIVQLSEILDSERYENTKSPLTLALGKGIAGDVMTIDLGKMPHLLIAGTTGAGKSVAVHVMMLSLLFKNLPEQVRLILIDPKMLELKAYEDIPHLITPVITDMKDAANALRWAVAEMEQRYQLMAALGTRNIEAYNHRLADAKKKGTPIKDPLFESDAEGEESAPVLETMPYIVIVIDEFADMMMVTGKKAEELIIRLAQKARAAGMHLLLATQRPSVDVITGLVKANIPARIAFQVSSKVDSRTILDQNGAEQLLGKGDMLFLAPGQSVPERIHGAYVSDQEVANVTNFLRQQSIPSYKELNVSITSPSGDGLTEDDDADALLNEAISIVTESRKASISYLQRRLKIGYNRAARMIEDMEAMGIVSAVQSNGTREVLAQQEGK